MSRPKQKIFRSEQSAEYKHRKTGKVRTVPIVAVHNGGDRNQISHHLQLSDGSLAKDLGPDFDFVRYVSNDDSTE